jgi:predicted permease
MLAGEIALTLIVVVGAGLLGTSLLRIYRSGLGFEGHGLLLVNLDVTKQGWKGPDSLRFYRDFANEAARIPGISHVTYARPTPLSGNTSWGDWYANGKKQTLYQSTVAPDYFRTMRIPLRTGREFAWSDTAATPLKAVLNQAAAQVFFPGVDPLGQQIRDSDGKDAKSYEVIGVVGNTKYGDMREALRPVVYEALPQDDLTLPIYSGVLRMNGKPDPVVSALRSLTARLAPGAPDPTFLTMDRQIDEVVSSERMIAMLAVFFALCALLVTGIGLYGTLAYSTARRTSEIGIRMALGAQRTQIAFLVFRENVIVAIIGSIAGLGVALLTSRALTTLLYNTSAHDVSVMTLSVAALGAIACIASLLPALHAARIEPMEAIRCE